MQLFHVDEKNGRIRIWLKDGSFRLFDFSPYFYVKIDENYDEKFISGHNGVKGVEAQKKRLFGKEINVFKIVFEDAESFNAVKASLSDSEIYEEDIPLPKRFMIDNKLIPYGEIEINKNEIKMKGESNSKFKMLSFDLETYTKGIINPRKDRIIAISIATNTGKKDVLISENEKELIEKFVKVVKEEDPGIIFTYNGDNFDFPYLIERAEQKSVKLDIGRDGLGISSRRGRSRKSYSVAGRETIDLYKVVERDLGEVKVRTLENVAEFLGLVKKGERTNLEQEELIELWEHRKENGLEKLRKYTLDDAVSTLLIGEKLLPMQLELSKLTKHFLTDITRMGRGRQVEWYLISKAFEKGELLPEHKYVFGERMYEGGFVLEPEKGLFENVVVMDFASMYPNIMIAYNISPDTYVPDCTEKEKCYISPIKHAFLKEPDGFFRSILKELIAERQRIKKLAKKDPLMNLRQHSIKILTNSFYGYTGWGGARWYKLQCAEATSAWGRYTIQEVIKMAGERGIKTIYSDTDSLFCVEEKANQIKNFAPMVNSKFPLEIEVREKYKTIFFGGKKRYAGLTYDNTIIVRGLEVRRGDWCELAKRLQNEIIEVVLKERNIEKAKRIAIEIINKIENGEVGTEDLTIYKSITKDISGYETKQAHVLALKRAIEGGEHIAFSNKIGYVVLEGHGKISDRTKLAKTLNERDRIDKKYYIENQVIPVVLRILEYFGVTKEELKGKKQQTLEKWF